MHEGILPPPSSPFFSVHGKSTACLRDYCTCTCSRKVPLTIFNVQLINSCQCCCWYNFVTVFYILCAYRLLNSMENRPESVLLGSVAVSFLLVLAADYLGASIELGCFLAGLAIGSQGHTVVDQVVIIHYICICWKLLGNL